MSNWMDVYRVQENKGALEGKKRINPRRSMRRSSMRPGRRQ